MAGVKTDFTTIDCVNYYGGRGTVGIILANDHPESITCHYDGFHMGAIKRGSDFRADHANHLT